MTPLCPRCRTEFVVTRRLGQTTAATLGGIAGAIQGASAAIAGSESSSSGKNTSNPLVVISGAILGGLIGGAAGRAVGAAIGAPIDQALLDNFRCQACGHVFDANRTDPALT
jgi:hypothetical protein